MEEQPDGKLEGGEEWECPDEYDEPSNDDDDID